MQHEQKIYFIISGVRDGFRKSHLLCNNDITEVIDYIDDRRQVANSAVESFYSIEKTKHYTLVSIFNPNTVDHVGRKAYIAITLFVRNDHVIKGNLISTLQHLMNYYEQKQGKEFTNRFTEEMFEAEYANLNIEHIVHGETGIRFKQGYIFYDQISDIASHFENPTINGYQKVYFLNSANIGVANQLMSFDKIVAFPKNVVYKVQHFGKGNYAILINNQPYSTAGKLQLNTLTLNINQGDTITIENRSIKATKTLVANASDTDINVEELFPIQNKAGQNKSVVGDNNVGNRGNNTKTPKKKNNQTILYIVVPVVISIVGFFIYKALNPPPPPKIIKGASVEAPPPPAPPIPATSTPTPTATTDTGKSTKSATPTNSNSSNAGNNISARDKGAENKKTVVKKSAENKKQGAKKPAENKNQEINKKKSKLPSDLQ